MDVGPQGMREDKKKIRRNDFHVSGIQLKIVTMKFAFLPLIFTFFLFFTNESLHGQKTEDVIYLKDGSIMRGIILEDTITGKVRILNHAGDTWSFGKDTIDSVRQEKPFQYKAFIFNREGSEFNFDGSLLIRSGNSAVNKAVVPCLHLGYGYRFGPYTEAGLITGFEFYEQAMLPLSLQGRFRLTSRAVSPFMLVGSGYTFQAEKKDEDWDYSYKGKGGVHFTAGVGIERILNENASFLISFAYQYQELNYHLTPKHQWVQERNRTETYNRIRISLGYVFK